MRFEHGKAAIEWVVQEVRCISGGLRAMLSTMNVGACTAFSFFPVMPAAADLEYFGGPCVDMAMAAEWAAHGYKEQNEFINEFLAASPKNVAIFQANYFRVNRQDLRLADGERIILVDRESTTGTESKLEGWEYLAEPQADLTRISDMRIRGMWPDHGVGLLTSLPANSPEWKAIQPIDRRLAEALAERAQYLIADAYSGGALIFVDLANRNQAAKESSVSAVAESEISRARRGRSKGLLWGKNLEEHGLTLIGAKEWRTTESQAGRPSSLNDFYAAHGICIQCRGGGVTVDQRSFCQACGGTGKVSGSL